MNIIQNPLRGSNSICVKCKHLLKRVIIPLDESQFGIDRAEFGISEEDEIVLEHYMCKEVFLDLDHIVMECNKFEVNDDNSLLRTKF